MRTAEEQYFEMATANTKLTRPIICADECLALMRDFAKEQVKLFAINGVINWVAVKDKLPEEGKYKIDYINWGRYGILHCAINSRAWEMNKPTHWAEIKPPNHS